MDQADIGFAADERGNGVAYVRCGAGEQAAVLRVPFQVKRFMGLRGREVGYAALAAAAAVLYRRGAQRVRLQIDDEALVRDLLEHRDVPAALTMSYVRLRCSLNRFASMHLEPHVGACDLTARARGEIALHIAA